MTVVSCVRFVDQGRRNVPGANRPDELT